MKQTQATKLFWPQAPNPKSPKSHCCHKSQDSIPVQSERLHKVCFAKVFSLNPNPLLYLRRERKLHEIDEDWCGRPHVWSSLGSHWQWWLKCWCLVFGGRFAADDGANVGNIKHWASKDTLYFVHCTLHPRWKSKQCTHSAFVLFTPNLSLPCLSSLLISFLSNLSPLTAVQCRFFRGCRYGRDRRGSMNNCWRYFYSDPLWSPFHTPLKVP